MTIAVKDAGNNTVNIEAPLPAGRAAAASSKPVALSNEDNTILSGMQTSLSSIQTSTADKTTPVPSVGVTRIQGASFNRPANGTAYSQGQLIANSTTAASVVPITVTAARVNGGTGTIHAARVSSSRSGPGTDVIRVHVYKGTAAGATNGGLVVAGGDGAALSVNGVAAVWLGSFDVLLDTIFSDGSKGRASSRAGADICFDTYAGQNTLFVLLEARTAITPTSGETLTVALEILSD